MLPYFLVNTISGSFSVDNSNEYDGFKQYLYDSSKITQSGLKGEIKIDNNYIKYDKSNAEGFNQEGISIVSNEVISDNMISLTFEITNENPSEKSIIFNLYGESPFTNDIFTSIYPFSGNRGYIWKDLNTETNYILVADESNPPDYFTNKKHIETTEYYQEGEFLKLDINDYTLDPVHSNVFAWSLGWKIDLESQGSKIIKVYIKDDSSIEKTPKISVQSMTAIDNEQFTVTITPGEENTQYFIRSFYADDKILDTFTSENAEVSVERQIMITKSNSNSLYYVYVYSKFSRNSEPIIIAVRNQNSDINLRILTDPPNIISTDSQNITIKYQHIEQPSSIFAFVNNNAQNSYSPISDNNDLTTFNIDQLKNAGDYKINFYLKSDNDISEIITYDINVKINNAPQFITQFSNPVQLNYGNNSILIMFKDQDIGDSLTLSYQTQGESNEIDNQFDVTADKNEFEYNFTFIAYESGSISLTVSDSFGSTARITLNYQIPDPTIEFYTYGGSSNGFIGWVKNTDFKFDVKISNAVPNTNYKIQIKTSTEMFSASLRNIGSFLDMTTLDSIPVKSYQKIISNNECANNIISGFSSSNYKNYKDKIHINEDGKSSNFSISDKITNTFRIKYYFKFQREDTSAEICSSFTIVSIPKPEIKSYDFSKNINNLNDQLQLDITHNSLAGGLLVASIDNSPYMMIEPYDRSYIDAMPFFPSFGFFDITSFLEFDGNFEFNLPKELLLKIATTKIDGYENMEYYEFIKQVSRKILPGNYPISFKLIDCYGIESEPLSLNVKIYEPKFPKRSPAPPYPIPTSLPTHYTGMKTMTSILTYSPFNTYDEDFTLIVSYTLIFQEFEIEYIDVSENQPEKVENNFFETKFGKYAFWPLIVGITLTIICLILVFVYLKKKEKENEADKNNDGDLFDMADETIQRVHTTESQITNDNPLFTTSPDQKDDPFNDDFEESELKFEVDNVESSDFADSDI